MTAHLEQTRAADRAARATTTEREPDAAETKETAG